MHDCISYMYSMYHSLPFITTTYLQLAFYIIIIILYLEIHDDIICIYTLLDLYKNNITLVWIYTEVLYMTNDR